jgi:CRP/FNR family cyclic AMP-dependent transcriptional regulator
VSVLDDYTGSQVANTIRLLEVDPELGRAIGDHDRLDRAIGAITGTYMPFEAGASRELTMALEDTRLGALVLDGFMVNEVTIAGRTTADLVGPEDLIRTGATAADASMLPRADSWSALTPVRLAMLDETFTTQASAWPEIVAALLERATRRGSRLVVGQAIRTLPSIDVRLLAFLWHLAAHWGVVLPRGVVIEAPVSHERLGRLIGSRRPTVTASVGRLRTAGLIEQREDGSWLVLGSLFSEGGAEDHHVLSGLEEMLLPSALGVRRRGLADAPARSRATAAREISKRLDTLRSVLSDHQATHEEQFTLMRTRAAEVRSASLALSDELRRTREARAARSAVDVRARNRADRAAERAARAAERVDREPAAGGGDASPAGNGSGGPETDARTAG